MVGGIKGGKRSREKSMEEEEDKCRNREKDRRRAEREVDQKQEEGKKDEKQTNKKAKRKGVKWRRIEGNTEGKRGGRRREKPKNIETGEWGEVGIKKEDRTKEHTTERQNNKDFPSDRRPLKVKTRIAGGSKNTKRERNGEIINNKKRVKRPPKKEAH